MKLEDEIRDALLPGAPDDETRAAWVKEALGRDPAPRRARIRPLWPALAAAGVLTIVFWPRADEPETAPSTHVAPEDEHEDEAAKRLNSTSVDEQRIANLKYYEEAEIGDARKGSWVVVVGGDSLRVTDKLDEAIAWADKLYPEAKHRLIVPIMNDDYPGGDVIVDRSPVALGIVGSWFFQSIDRKPELRKELTLDVQGRTMKVRVDTDSAAPLVLPAGVSFPLFELRGRMILEDSDGSWRSFRRYYVRVRCRDPKLDTWVEAIGTESKEKYAPGHWIATRLGTHVFHALRRPPAEQAVIEKKPLLVLRIKEGSHKYLDDLLEPVEIEGLAQLAVPQAEETVIERYDERGKLVGRLPLPDASDETRAHLEKLLRLNRK